MAKRPTVIAFDIIQTVFSTEPLRPRLVSLGLPQDALDTWFAAALRDAFALAATDRFAPFRSVLAAALDEVLVRHGFRVSGQEEKASLLEAFTELPAHPDAREAFEALRAADVRIIALSNGAASATESLLQKAALDGFVEHIVSVDDVRLSKPRREVYQHAADVANVRCDELGLVAAHAWDVHGAKAAGLLAGFVARGNIYPETMLTPDVTGDSLVEVAEKFVSLD